MQEDVTYVDWVGVGTNSPVNRADCLSALVHLLWVYSILGMQVLDLTIGEDSVKLTVCLELVSQL